MKASTAYRKEHNPEFGHEKISILYEDEYLVIIFKPNGMLTCPYPGSKAKTAQDALEQIMRKRGTFSKNHKPLVVHRLDRDTSGVMMFALTETAQKKIMDTWHQMVTERIYHAVAENSKTPLPPSGLINDVLAFNAHNFGFVPKGENAKNFETITARTHYKILRAGPTHTLFELSLDTGRKNQIRAHLASKGYILAGDENYHANTDPFGRLALHARTLEFDHPFTKEHLKFEMPEPDNWESLVINGDKSAKPIWKTNHQDKKQSKPAIKDLDHRPTRKSMRNMDFIQKGKNRY